MEKNSLTERYNYDSFVPEKFSQWMNFDSSPEVGKPAPDFPIWELNGAQTQLSEIWSEHAYTVVEFGSFT
jgi:hypothetical protein